MSDPTWADAPEPCAAAVEAGAVALASRYHGAKITAGTMVLYYGEAEAVLTAAWPILRRQVIGECRRAVLGSPLANWEAVDNILRALLADAGQPKEVPPPPTPDDTASAYWGGLRDEQRGHLRHLREWLAGQPNEGE